MQSQLAFPPECLSIPESFGPILAPGHKTGSPVPLFQKMDPATAEEFKKRFAGKRQEQAKDGVAKSTSKPASSQPKPSGTVSSENIDPALVAQLEAEVTKQGNIVREAKTNKSAKDVIDAEVKKLLELKSKLAVAKGEDPNATPNKSKGKKEASKPTPSQPKPAETTSNENIDQALVAQLEAEVATQGNIVRETKTNKSAKDVIDAEVKKLLELKSKLALAKGEDPNATPNKSKGKKKKK